MQSKSPRAPDTHDRHCRHNIHARQTRHDWHGRRDRQDTYFRHNRHEKYGRHDCHDKGARTRHVLEAEVEDAVPVLGGAAVKCKERSRTPVPGRVPLHLLKLRLSLCGAYTAIYRFPRVYGGGGGGTHIMHRRSRMTIDPRIPTTPGRSTSGFHRPGRHCLHQAQSAVRWWSSHVKGELHPTKNRF